MQQMTDILEDLYNYWGNDYNCSRSVARGILDHFKMKKLSKTIDKALYAFGGGMGERSICGAVTGGLVALSVYMVEKGIETEKMGEVFKEFKMKFSEKNNSLRCRELIGSYILEDGSVDKDSTERKEICNNAVESAVLIAKELIEKL